MRHYLESDKDFEVALREVSVLYSVARKSQGNHLEYKTYNKSALLLLIAKFEHCLENMIQDYINNINKFNLEAQFIPIGIKRSHTLFKLKNYQALVNQSSKEFKRLFEDIGFLWISQKHYNDLKVDTKFSFGRHGEEELEKLLKKIGFDNIFLKIKVHKKVMDVSVTKGFRREKIDFKGILNSIIHQRHNIIHEDATPNLTHEDIYKYQVYITQFIKKLSKLLQRNLEKLKGKL